ncbi:CHAD domain-containing protein [Rubripirellula amarantea]|nr:CHAD domain-containing protein [Rubripirellula amarantea]
MKTCAPTDLSASQSLGKRLSDVQHFLPLAAKHADEDCEYVHQLRVATREAIAGLDLYEDRLPSQQVKWLRRELKRIRAAAGEARDLDVMLAYYENCKTSRLKKLKRCLKKQRAQAQGPLKKIQKRLSSDRRLSNRIVACVVALDLASANEVSAMVESHVAEAARSLAAVIQARKIDHDSLHLLRKRAKHLRYCIELQQESIPNDSLRKLYSATCSIQKSIGLIHDRVVVSQYLLKLRRKVCSKRFESCLKKLRRKEKCLAKRERKKFLRWFNGDRRESICMLTESLDAPKGFPANTTF